MPSSSARRWMVVLALLWPLLAGAAPVDRDLEARMLEVAAGLRCPVCQNLSVADSSSELATEMRGLIRDQLSAGRTPDEIRAYFVSKYGQWVLLSPEARGFGLVVWTLPAVGAVAGLAGAGWVIRRWARRGPVPSVAPDGSALIRVRELASREVPLTELAPEERREIEGLRELEFDHRAGKLSDEDHQALRALYEARAAVVLAAGARSDRTRAGGPDGRREAGRRRTPGRGVWRWATGAVFLVALGGVTGYALSGALQPRVGDAPMTGGALARGVGPAAGRDDLSRLLADGRQAFDRRDLSRAIEMFSGALRLDPDHPVANAYFGLILLQAGHNDRALASFERALARDPRLVPALWGKGLVLYQARGEIPGAIAAWEALLSLDLAPEDRDHVLKALQEARARQAG